MCLHRRNEVLDVTDFVSESLPTSWSPMLTENPYSGGSQTGKGKLFHVLVRMFSCGSKASH